MLNAIGIPITPIKLPVKDDNISAVISNPSGTEFVMTVKFNFAL
jgi:hypothetical protein